MSENVAINSLLKEDLKQYIVKLGEKQYRAKQLWRWIYVNGVKSFNDMSDIGVNLRNKLNYEVSFNRLDADTHQISEDGTQKWLFSLKDKRKIETVFIPEADRGTLCISSQVGCTLSCSFCHTGDNYYQKVHMFSMERIKEELEYVASYASKQKNTI